MSEAQPQHYGAVAASKDSEVTFLTGEQRQPAVELLSDPVIRSTTSKLRWLHSVAAAFMLLQTILLSATPLKTRIPQTVGFPYRDENTTGPVGVPQVKTSYEIPVQVLISLFVGLSALDHFICALIGWFNPALAVQYIFVYYRNPLRWLEYSFSASLMSVLLASLSGIYDLHMLILIGSLTGICQVLGGIIEYIPVYSTCSHNGADAMEKGRKPSSDSGSPNKSIHKCLYWIATVACGLSYLPILCYFFSTSGMPGFVYAAFLGTLVCYCTFGINFYRYFFSSKYDFATSEKIYVVLSFVAKTFLAWDVWGGFKASE